MEATQFDVIIETLKLSEVDVETMNSRKKALGKDIKVGSVGLCLPRSFAENMDFAHHRLHFP